MRELCIHEQIHEKTAAGVSLPGYGAGQQETEKGSGDGGKERITRGFPAVYVQDSYTSLDKCLEKYPLKQKSLGIIRA